MSGVPTDDKPARLHAVVHGWVQGVGFRAATQRAAAQHNLSGWVRNHADGTVETVAEGPRPALEAFEQFLHRGPALAEVERVDVSYSPASGEFAGFNIRY
ncbi:MAG: acylphosphatase [Chloroflexi bacterium]|nr:acylphosphatase [Chloroflexota bacterium]